MNKERVSKEVKDWTKSLIIAMVITAIILYFIWPTRVRQTSMENTLKNGQYIFASSFLYDIAEPEYLDIAVMKVNYDGTREKRIVKRIIGLEGDHIVIKDGKVFKNGQMLNEEYIKENNTVGEVDLFVPRGEAFVLGDNRQISVDSRAFGTVSLKKIYAKVLFKN